MTIESGIQRLTTAVRESVRDDAARRRALDAAVAAYAGPLRLVVLGAPDAGATTLVGALRSPDQRDDDVFQIFDGSAHSEETAGTALSLADLRDRADAVLYVAHHGRADDVTRLEALVVAPAMRGLDVVVALGRADEVGGGRQDALLGASVVANRLARLGGLHDLTSDVVPIAGLVACGARDLTASEFTELRKVARLPATDRDRQLLSADRFAAGGGPRRRDLLTRLGLYGVRLAVGILAGATLTRDELTADLRRRSGLPRLQSVLAERFAGRAETLKRASFQRALHGILGPADQQRAAVARADDEIEAAARDVAEMRALAEIADGVPGMPRELEREAVRLLGGVGSAPAERLDLDAQTSESAIHRAAAEALERWRDFSEGSGRHVAAAEVGRLVARSCEAILVETPEPSFLRRVHPGRVLATALGRSRDGGGDRSRNGERELHAEGAGDQGEVIPFLREKRGGGDGDHGVDRQHRDGDDGAQPSGSTRGPQHQGFGEQNHRERDEHEHERRQRDPLGRLLVAGSHLLDDLAQRRDASVARRIEAADHDHADDQARDPESGDSARARQASSDADQRGG